MFKWLLILQLQMGGEVDVEVFNVHQTLDDCLESSKQLLVILQTVEQPEDFERIDIYCEYDEEGVEI